MKIDDRVRVVDLPQGMHGTDVFLGEEVTWVRIGCSKSRHAAELTLGDLRAAIRLACEAVRDQCVELVDTFGAPEGNAPQDLIDFGRADPEALCRATADAVQKRIAAAIRGLEL